MSSSSMSLGVVSLGAPTAGVDPEGGVGGKLALAVVAVDRFLLLEGMNAMLSLAVLWKDQRRLQRAWLVLDKCWLLAYLLLGG